MQSMFAGYMWGMPKIFTVYTFKFDKPYFIFADASLSEIIVREGAEEGSFAARAWVYSVTVQDPSTGEIKETFGEDFLPPVRIEGNAIAVTWGLLGEGFGGSLLWPRSLIHAFLW